ncbi:transposase, IS605 family (plasmid) [Deferribacter desulfuricans SSM1]|uniref:Transposase, IS605 family n=1 Tax=Deferribacter desulfuricans (strain DSM 14783 / JCM 11476 / NBRC 101012 / SSM1) TaxID=639282 RepID=D3PEI9_DEFDS|nr:RNA-guided endonuclease TnpB family protein [Deferribacter desulfuricans]BAI81631.1 transposase, IS605 family [Deferribacter desulfuricans SSM1]BAI81664.1 transposase, IS605 family [Deferribacter desulfuricans SSM1]BAI81666.1 transposase, IS605 family [Deferribacter desulfuricans SSM1]BAI81669.1 transposase, IS605 family [Deferribacter desulfuricans SSM1]BAI81678.1 transposase, IS605 family [Deferribacter desulfuricans SSM1]
MITCQAFKFKLKTNEELENKFAQFAGSCRFVWNKAIALIKQKLDIKKVDKIINIHLPQYYKNTATIPTYNEMAGMLKLWKQSEEYAFLKEAHSQILQQTLKDLYKAIDSAFTKGNGISFPDFRKKGKSPDSFRYPQGFKINNNRIFLPKIGWVRFYKSRNIVGKPKNVTVKRYADGWYISVVTEKDTSIKENLSNPVGIDVGVKKIITLSNGCYFEPLDLSKYEKKLIKLQRQLSRKQHPTKKGDKTPFSNNYKKHQRKIAKMWLKIANVRNDYLHKITTAIAKKHGFVAVENLKVKNLTKSAKGTKDSPGRNVKAKSGLNRSILSRAWGRFFELLEYKLQRNGGKLVRVDAKNTSITCPLCDYTNKENRKNQAVFVCKKCGFTSNADLVGAINVLMRAMRKENLITLPQGLREVTPVEYAREYTLKQEPAGNREGLPLPSIA